MALRIITHNTLKKIFLIKNRKIMAEFTHGIKITPILREDSENSPSKDASTKESPSKDGLSKDSPSKDALSKDSPSKDALSKDSPSKDYLSKDSPSSDNLSKITPSSTASSSGSSSGSTGDKTLDITPISGRITRQEPWPVIFGVFPVSWRDFFYEKTGVSGFYTFMFTFGCYLTTKEIIVMEHEYYNGLGSLAMWILAVKFLGPSIAKSLDKEIDAYETGWNQGRVDEKELLANSIEHERMLQVKVETNTLLVAAKREAVVLQQEAEYRKRFMTVYNQVMDLLVYQQRVGRIHTYYTQRNMIEWVTREVMAVITPEWKSKYLDECIEKLDKMPREYVVKSV